MSVPNKKKHEKKPLTSGQKLTRKRKLFAVISALLAFLMVFSTLASGLMYAFATTKEELNAQLDEIDDRSAEAQAQVDAYNDEIGSYMEKMAALDYQMQITMEDIALTEQMIALLEQDVSVKEDEILLAEDKLEEKEELFATRVRVMYEVGETTYLEVLLSSDSFTDMLSNVEMISQIMQFDTQVVTELEDAMATLEALKAELEENIAITEQSKLELEEKNAQLEQQKVEYQEVVDALEADKELYEAELTRMEEEKSEINAEIERLSKLEAEAAAAKAAAEAAANGSSSSSSGTTYTGTLTWPCPVYTYISSPFGYRTSPTAGASTYHKGVDLAAATGNTVVAAESGTVVKSYFSSSYGNYIVISHGNGLMTGYAHMSVRSVSEGDTVVAGQKIGEVGSTGISTGAHLHFEVYENGTAVDPMGYFS